MKGQVNLEFLAASALYILALGSIMLSGTDALPSYHQDVDRISLNLEARTLTNEMLSHPGEHSYGPEGSSWEENSSTVNSIESFGLAEDFLQLERSKLEKISTVGEDDFNYTQFKNVTEAEHQYRFRFTWMPIVHTNGSFTRGDPPVVEGERIGEPGDNEEEPYNLTDNEVHYGSITLKGNRHHFLVTARNGIYNGTYVSDSWDFGEGPFTRGDSFNLYGTSYGIEGFQNREDDEGSVLILSEELNEFGAGLDILTEQQLREEEGEEFEADVGPTSTVEKLTRFPRMEGHPVRMEVWVW